jgi:hypothetical protein
VDAACKKNVLNMADPKTSKNRAGVVKCAASVRGIKMSGLRYLAVAVMLVFLGMYNAAAQDAAKTEPMPSVPAQYSATAVGQSGSAAGKTFGMNVYIEQLSTDGEIDELLGTLKSKGPDGLLSAMEDLKDKGRVAPTGSVGTGMKVIRIRPGKDGGLHIVLVTNRPITFGELYNGTRSRDYPFGIVVLEVDKSGKGTGTFAPVCKIRFNKKKELEIEHYGQKPFRLVNVNREK